MKSSTRKQAYDIEFDYLEYRGLSVRYARRCADSSHLPMLIFNGIGQSIEVMEPIIEEFDDREIVIFDVPGTGKSDTPALPWRMKQHAKLAAALLEELDHPTVDVMGFSWGGTLAKHFCRYHSNRVNKLILAAAPPGNLMIPGNPGVYLRVMNPKRFHQKDYMRSIAPHIYGGDVRHSLDVVDKNASRLIPPNPKGYLFQGISMYGTASLLWLSRLKQPTLILQGVDDPMVPNLNALMVNALLPNSQLEFVGCGHMFMLTRLKEIAPKINAFLDA